MEIQYNLTEKQKDLLRTLVSFYEGEQMDETFEIEWRMDQTAQFAPKSEVSPITISRGAIDALTVSGLILVTAKDQEYETIGGFMGSRKFITTQYFCTLTKAGIDAAHSNFHYPETNIRKDLLHFLLSEKFNMTELRTMCMKLGIDDENISGQEKITFTRNLIQYVENRGRLWDLVQLTFTTK